MTSRETHIAQLLQQHWLGELTDEQAVELAAWRNEKDIHEEFFNHAGNAGFLKDAASTYREFNKAAVWEQLKNKLETDRKEITGKTAFHRVHFLKTAWFRVAVAILIILTGFFFYIQSVHTSGSGKEMVSKPSPQPDVLPGGNRATLTLADGSQIVLDSAGSGKLAEQTGATIRKTSNGEIIYAFDQSTVSSPVVYNTMSTPRGGQYQLTLADGTRVWLNAASSITFPTAFKGSGREVSITGEAYFEVAPNKSKPFIVHTRTGNITVLGTAFNANTYEEEQGKISLLNGVIKINEKILKPGEAYTKGKLVSTNLDQDIAWKSGHFSFEKANIFQVMRQITRWYDVEVKYEGNIPGDVEINGKMGRDLTLNNILRILKGLEINSRLEGKIIIVSP